jgi:hypothetical protein
LKKSIVPVRTEIYTPNDWLEFILVNKLYVDCLDTWQVDECAKDIARKLRDRGKKSSGGTAAGTSAKQDGEIDCCAQQ